MAMRRAASERSGMAGIISQVDILCRSNLHKHNTKCRSYLFSGFYKYCVIYFFSSYREEVQVKNFKS